MSDWSRGYPTDNAYAVNMQTEINPWRWRQSMLFANFQPPDPSRPFRFLELGCGSATTLIALAALYPQGTFVGYDYMPEHIVLANRLIEETGLTNVTVLEGSFGEMAAAPPAEKFDFAAAHGVWAWVPEPVRAEIVQVLADWLAPGAVAYFGYNAAAGWSSAEPIRQIFRNAPRGRGVARFDAARAAVDGWLEMNGEQFGQAKTLWSKLRKAPDSFLAHEIASPSGTGVWPQEIAGPLAEAKMAFAGPAVLAEHMDALFLEDGQVAYLRDAVEQGWGEIARDLVHRRTFRNDLFHRGAPAVSGARMVAEMRDLRLVPWDEELQLGTHPSVYGQMKRGLDDRAIEGLQELCAGGGTTFGDCMDAIGAEPMQAFQAVMMAYVAGGLIDLRPETEIEAARDGCARFNAVMLRQLRDSGIAPGLAAPGYGGCIQFQDEAQRDAVAGRTQDAALVARLETLGITLG